MPVQKPTTLRCTNLTLKVGIRANLGNYEDFTVEAGEEYSLDGTMKKEETQILLMSNLVKFLRTELARMLEPLDLSQGGKAPAGQLATYLKESKLQ